MSDEYIPPPLFTEQKPPPEPKPVPKPAWLDPDHDDKLLEHLVGKPKALYHSVGQIQRIELPEGWKPSGEMGDTGMNSSLQHFHPKNDPHSRLEFYYRGHRVPEGEANAFRKVLGDGGHALNAAELKALGSILRGKDRPDDFQIDLALVVPLIGKAVMMLEGTFLPDRKRNLTLFIDSDGTGSAVQEVSLIAPAAAYEKLKPAIERALQTIIWRHD